jgi:hypothetical protein
MRERELVEDGCQENAADSPVEVPERVDPLKPPVHPGKQFSESARVFLSRAHVPQPLGEIVAEQVHQDGNLVGRRGRVCPDLNVDVTVSAGPGGKQRPGESSVAPAKPFRGDRDVLRPGLEDFFEDTYQREGQSLRHLRVGEGSLGGVEVPRRAYLPGVTLRLFRRLLRRAIFTGSFSNAIDSATRARIARR